MNKVLVTVAEAGLLLTFATGAMAALFDPSATTLATQGIALGALLVLGALRVTLNRSRQRADR